MRKVLIATPSYDGKVEAWYVNSLLLSMNICAQKGIALFPIWLSYDALIQRSRNDLIKIAVENNFDSIIWIDSDIEWSPEWVLKLLQYKYDVIGGSYRKKTDEEELYTIKTNNININEDGILEVDGLGTGFLKMSRKAFMALWDCSEEYECEGKNARMVFEVGIKDGILVGEDIFVCNKLKELGFNIYLDTNMTCNHIGIKKYYGNIAKWLENYK